MRRKLLLWLVMFAMVYVFFEGASYGTLALLKWNKGVDYAPTQKSSPTILLLEEDIKDENSERMLSPTLGWTNRPNAHNSENAREHIQINSQGMRADHEYALDPPPCTTRIATFGDSYTFGSEISNHETWQTILESALPRSEVLNFGVGGYGIDQALLHYQQDGIPFRSNIAMMGLIVEDIFRANTSVRAHVTKPQFVMNKGSLELAAQLTHSPGKYIPDLEDEDGSYEGSAWDILPSMRLVKILHSTLTYPPEEDSETTASLALSIFDTFTAEVRKQNGTPVIVFFPTWKDFDQFRENGTTRYSGLLEQMRGKNAVVIDVINAFKDRLVTHGDDEFFGKQHYNAFAAKIVGRYLASALQQNGLPPLAENCQ